MWPVLIKVKQDTARRSNWIPDTVKVCALVKRGEDPEMWDGDIWCDDRQEILVNGPVISPAPCTPLVPLAPYSDKREVKQAQPTRKTTLVENMRNGEEEGGTLATTVTTRDLPNKAQEELGDQICQRTCKSLASGY